MRLRVRTWGTGPRTALLVHGYSDDSRTWWRVAPAVAELGFTVLAPDLRGHGESERARSYALADFAQDLLDTVPVDPGLAVGHSLGALVLGLAAPGLRPRRAIFLDPPWLRDRADLQLDRPLPTAADQLPPAWSPEDVAVDLASNACTDAAVTRALMAEVPGHAELAPPPACHTGALVVVPALEPALPVVAHPAVTALGYDIATVPDVGHVMHRDDFDGFMRVLRPLLDGDGLAA